MARLLALAVTLLAAPALAQAPKVGDPPEASNMRLVGMSDLQARSAYQPTIHHQGDRWIAYIGHHGGSDEIPAPVNPQTGKATGGSRTSATTAARTRFRDQSIR